METKSYDFVVEEWSQIPNKHHIMVKKFEVVVVVQGY